jgi:hypothetical protein
MKRLIIGGTVCAVALAAAILFLPGELQSDVPQPITENVIIVVIDGLRCYEAFHRTPYSNYVECMRDSLCDEGTLYPNLWNRGVTQTHGGHQSIATGAWQLMPNNLTYFGPSEDTISTQPDIPTFFEYFSKTVGYSPDSNKVFYFGGKTWKDTLVCSVDPEYGREYAARVVIKNE